MSERPPIRPVSVADLKKGNVYISVSYLDEQLLVPIVETLIFLDVDIFREGCDLLFFQHAESFFERGEFVPGASDREELLVAEPDGLNNIFTVPNGSDALTLCAGRWRRLK